MKRFSSRLLQTCSIASTVLMAIVLGGCGEREPEDLVSASIIRVEFDSSDPERIARYYLGGYLGVDAGDPFDAGLAIFRDGRVYLNLDSLHSRYPAAIGRLEDENRNNRLEWEEFAAFVQATYADSRELPTTVSELLSDFPELDDEEAWFTMAVDGVMTTATRRVHVPRTHLMDAVVEYRVNDEQILYPIGTIFVGEHYLDERLYEVTAMQKRSDGYWDFAVYDSTGTLATTTTSPPRPLSSPTQCVGCHFGSRRFEPEASFPATARPGPHGPRAIHVPPDLRNDVVVRFFNEHARRSDTILGLYATLLVSDLVARERTGGLRDDESRILESLRLDLQSDAQ